LTLIELLVAMTVLLIAVAAALTMYDATLSSFKKSENAAAQQQGTRIAFDRIGADLQLAGFNFNPDGDEDRPDEQVEAAYDTAVVTRADYDCLSEPSLAGDEFATVSTANDEIVAYVLAKPDGSSLDTLSFKADMEEERRDGDTEWVDIDNVSLVQDDPPYTLYRITFNGHDTWNSESFFNRQVLAENIGSMTFRYYDAAGTQLNTFDLTGASDDIGGDDTDALISQRARIERVEVDLVGLARDPDPAWVDRTDFNPGTRPFHKFQLVSSIRRRNNGMSGLPDVLANAGFDIGSAGGDDASD